MLNQKKSLNGAPLWADVPREGDGPYRTIVAPVIREKQTEEGNLNRWRACVSAWPTATLGPVRSFPCLTILLPVGQLIGKLYAIYLLQELWLFVRHVKEISAVDHRNIKVYSESLRAGRSVDRISVGARFSAPVHTGPGAHPASYTMGTGTFPEVKRPRRGVDHPTPI
jgi:hypothetical protein